MPPRVPRVYVATPLVDAVADRVRVPEALARRRARRAATGRHCDNFFLKVGMSATIRNEGDTCQSRKAL